MYIYVKYCQICGSLGQRVAQEQPVWLPARYPGAFLLAINIIAINMLELNEVIN